MAREIVNVMVKVKHIFNDNRDEVQVRVWLTDSNGQKHVRDAVQVGDGRVRYRFDRKTRFASMPEFT